VGTVGRLRINGSPIGLDDAHPAATLPAGGIDNGATWGERAGGALNRSNLHRWVNFASEGDE
jgi:hypothetical protein